MNTNFAAGNSQLSVGKLQIYPQTCQRTTPLTIQSQYCSDHLHAWVNWLDDFLASNQASQHASDRIKVYRVYKGVDADVEKLTWTCTFYTEQRN